MAPVSTCMPVSSGLVDRVFTYIESLPTYNYRLPILPTDILQMSSLHAKFRLEVPDASWISAWGVFLEELMKILVINSTKEGDFQTFI